MYGPILLIFQRLFKSKQMTPQILIMQRAFQFALRTKWILLKKKIPQK